MTALEVAESLKEVVKVQAEVIYAMALEIEQHKQAGSDITDAVSDKILKAAKTLQEVSGEI